MSFMNLVKHWSVYSQWEACSDSFYGSSSTGTHTSTTRHTPQ